MGPVNDRRPQRRTNGTNSADRLAMGLTDCVDMQTMRTGLSGGERLREKTRYVELPSR